MKKRRSTGTIAGSFVLALATAASLIGVTGASAVAPPATADTPRTEVLLSVSPNPSHYGEGVRFQWTATGFPGPVTCNDNKGWIVNGPGHGSFEKKAGIDFTASFWWVVSCEDENFFAQRSIYLVYVPSTTPPPPPPTKPAGGGATYIVFLEQAGSPQSVVRTANRHADEHGGRLRRVFRALGGYSIELPSKREAELLSRQRDVALVTRNAVYRNVLSAAPESPRTSVWTNASPNPSHPNELVTFQWVANGFHGTVTCNDNRGWIVNGPGSGSFTKRAGVDFTSSFQWVVDCDDGDFFARGTFGVTYDPTPPPPPPPPPNQCVDPPYNLSPPTVTGSTVPGSTLTGYAGDWDYDGSVCISRYEVTWEKYTLSGQFMGNMRILSLYPPNKTDYLGLAVSDTGYKYRLRVAARGPQGFERYSTLAYSAFTSPVYCSGGSQSIPTGVDRIQADLSSQVSGNCSGMFTSSPNVVAVIDSGIAAHPDLNVVGRDTCVGGSPEGDVVGHGTRVAGLAAAKDNLVGIVGVAPGWPLRSEKVIYDNGSLTDESVICGLDAASFTRIDGIKGNDVGVANLSLGAYGPRDDRNCGNTNGDALHQAVCRARSRGMVIVASAGNEWAQFADLPLRVCDTPCAVRPATYEEVLTVTAMADYNGTGAYVGQIARQCGLLNDDDTRVSEYSNFALTTGIYSYHVNHTAAAPGNCILSTTAGGGYAPFSGTSAAAPIATGIVALCLALPPPSGCSGLPPGQVVSTVINQARDYGTSHPDHRFLGDGFSTQGDDHWFGYLLQADTY